MPRKEFYTSIAKGMSLLEVSICMAILAILSTGATNLLQSGVQNEMIARSQQLQQTLAIRLLTTMRTDLRSAENVTVSGNTLSFTSLGQPITYTYGNNTIARSIGNGATIDFSDPVNQLSISCQSPCFSSVQNMAAVGQPIIEVSMNGLTIQDAHWSSKGPGLSYGVDNATFNILNGNTFQ